MHATVDVFGRDICVHVPVGRGGYMSPTHEFPLPIDRLVLMACRQMHMHTPNESAQESAATVACEYMLGSMPVPRPIPCTWRVAVHAAHTQWVAGCGPAAAWAAQAATASCIGV